MKLNKKGLQANIAKYYVLRCLVKRMVWPILTLYLLRHNLSAEQIGVIFATCTIVGIVFEVPSGAFADWFGRKRTLALSMIISALSMLVLWQMTGFWGAMVGQLIYTFASSFWSGTHDAFIYETLVDLDRIKDFKKVTGRALFYSQTITGVLFVGVPVIAMYSLSLPFLLNAGVYVLATLLCLNLTEPRQESESSVLNAEPKESSIRSFFKNPALLAVGTAFGVIGGIAGILESFRQVYLNDVGFNLAYFGLIYLLLRLLVGFAGDRVSFVEKKLGRTLTLALVPALGFVAYAGLALVSGYWWLIFIALDGVQSGLSRPLEMEYLNKIITKGRATMLSIYNVLEDIIGAVFIFIAGYVINWQGVKFGMGFAAVSMLVFAVPAFMWFLRHDRKLR
jgi:MFS family permease